MPVAHGRKDRFLINHNAWGSSSAWNPLLYPKRLDTLGIVHFRHECRLNPTPALHRNNQRWRPLLCIATSRAASPEQADATARELKYGDERAQERLLRENDASAFSAAKQNLATENVRALTVVMAEAEMAREEALATRCVTKWLIMLLDCLIARLLAWFIYFD